MAQLIYVAENDKTTRDLISNCLENDGFDIETFSEGTALLAAFEVAMPDLLVLDVNLPGANGLNLCSQLHHDNPALSIVLLSDSDNPYERVTGFSFGCDDYMVIPFLPLELIARVRAVLRRSRHISAEPKRQKHLTYGPLRLFPDQRTAFVLDNRLLLTPAEFDFLAYLIQNTGSAVSRKDLLKNLWQLEWQANTRATDDLVKRLRRKLRELNSPVRIETVWGYGFRLAMDIEA